MRKNAGRCTKPVGADISIWEKGKMAEINVAELAMYQGRLLNANDWDSNFETIVRWLTSGDYNASFDALACGNQLNLTGNKIINLSGVNYDSMLSAWTADGTGGAGGKGGKGGTGGPGGKSFWGSQAPNGTDGEDGFDGAQGGDPRPYAYMTSTRANACSDCDLEMIRLRQLREYIIERLGAEIAASKYDF